MVANPFNPKQVREVDLRPAPLGAMEALVLWTRNPAPMLDVLEEWETRGVRSLWLVTVTGYPLALESGAPDVGRVAQTLAKLSAMIGRERIIWRYDPLFASSALGMDAKWHADNFRRLSDILAGSVSGVILSLYDEYRAAKRRLAAAGIDFDPEAALEAAGEVASVCAREGIPAQSCCEELTGFGVEPGGCIDGGRLNRLFGIREWRRDGHQRRGCLCAESVDIGGYGACAHGCLYCYATRGAV